MSLLVIRPSGELVRSSTELQRDYLGRLAVAHDRVVIDVVRCWARLPGLYRPGLQVLTVHLLREPIGWVAAHMLPTGRMTWRKHIGDAYRRLSFFTRRGFYDNYQYEEIIDEALARHHWLWAYLPITPAELARQPAFVKLLAFWWCANLTLRRSLVEAELPHRTVTLHDFARQPKEIVQEVSAAAGWAGLDFDVSAVRPVRPGWRPTSRRWLEAAELLGMPHSLFEPAGYSAVATVAALDEALARRPG